MSRPVIDMEPVRQSDGRVVWEVPRPRPRRVVVVIVIIVWVVLW
jgi:hypothetical protein